MEQIAAENLPPFALPDDSIVEVQGEAAGVHKAVELIASNLRKFLVDRSVIPVFEMQVSFRALFHVFMENVVSCYGNCGRGKEGIMLMAS